MQEAVDAFVNNANFYENSDPHGKVLSEVIITMDSAGLQHAYLPQVTEWLTRWNDQYAQNWYMRNAVNGVFTILFGGQWNDQYLQIIGNQAELAKALGDFALRESSIGASDEFMVANAGRELGRLTKDSGSAATTVSSKLKDILLATRCMEKGMPFGLLLRIRSRTTPNAASTEFVISKPSSKVWCYRKPTLVAQPSVFCRKT